MKTFRLDHSMTSPPFSGFPVWIAVIMLLTLHFSPVRAEATLDVDFRRHYYERLGDRFYQTRELPRHLLKAIASYRRALGFTEVPSDLHWKITRCYWVLATKQAADAADRKRYYAEGMRHGLLAVKNNPESANAFVWTALIHGNHALEQGVMNALYLRGQLKQWLERALELDGRHVNALLGMAGWYFYVPEFFGGDKTRAYQLVDQALKVDPHYTAILLQKAEYLMTDGRETEAAAVLQKILDIKKPTLRNDGLEDKAMARQLLDELKNRQKIL